MSIINISIKTYGIFLFLSFLIFYYYLTIQLNNNNKKKMIVNIIFYILLGAIFGARVLFLIIEWEYFLDFSILSIFSIWNGGLVFIGGVIGSICSFYFFLKFKKIFNLYIINIFILGIPLMHLIGRIGCFFSGCCYGKIAFNLNMNNIIKNSFFLIKNPINSSSFKSFLFFSDPNMIELIIKSGKTFPLISWQLLESCLLILIFFILFFIKKHRIIKHDYFIFYIFLYSILRFILEYYRGDKERGFFVDNLITASQFIFILFFFLILIKYFFKKIIILKNKNIFSEF
jgi:phosphatidylglycerol:prolipoprotein diacylglycerol transferase